MTSWNEADFIPYQAVHSLAEGPALLFAPHPDDEVFGCAGAILRHVDAGEAVRVVILTDGELYGTERRQEAERAAAELGYGRPEFWGYGDRALNYGEPLIQRMQQAIERSRARIVYAPSVHEIHPDHRACAMAAVEAVRRAGGERWLAMYEIGVPQPANRLLDISDLATRKRRAVCCFDSQLARHDYADFVAGLNRYRAYTLGPEVSAAEAYHLIAAHDLSAGLQQLYQSLARRNSRGAAFGERPLVSIILRSWGRAGLVEALDALALQTWPHCELVVVDGAAVGITELTAWGGPFPLRVVGGGGPLSSAQAANLGLEQAQGEYQLLLDREDRLDPDHISGLMALLEQTPSRRAAYAGVALEEGAAECNGIRNTPWDPQRLLIEDLIPLNAVLFHRDLALGCRFDEALGAVVEAWDFWLQLAARGAFAHRDRVTARRCLTDAELSSNSGEEGARGRLYAKWLPQRSPAEWLRLFDDCRSAQRRVADCEQRLAQQAAQFNAGEEARREAYVVRQQAELQGEEMQAVVAALREENAQLQDELNRTQEGLEAVHHSTSWRLTAPLRWLARGLGRR